MFCLRLSCWLLLVTGLGFGAAVSPLQAQAPAQKKVLTFADSDIWNQSPQGMTLSPDGKYVAYHLMPIESQKDGAMVLRFLPSGKETRFARGQSSGTNTPSTKPEFSNNSRWLGVMLPPTKADLDKAKAEKKKPEEMPKWQLALINTESAKITQKFDQVKSFKLIGEGDGQLVIHKAPKPAAKEEAKPTTPQRPPSRRPSQAPPTAPSPRPAPPVGTELIIRDLKTGKERTVAEVSSYTVSDDGQTLAYIVTAPVKEQERNGVYVLNPSQPDKPAKALKVAVGRFTKLTWDRGQKKLAFFHDPTAIPEEKKDEAKEKVDEPPSGPTDWNAYVWALNTPTVKAGATSGPASAVGVAVSPAKLVLEAQTKGRADEDQAVVITKTLRFNDNGSKLFVETQPVPTEQPEKPTGSRNPAENFDLDIWHWKDGYVPPMRRKREAQDRNRSFLAVVHLDTGKFRQLASENLSVSSPAVGDWAVASDNEPYLKFVGYGPSLRDVYLLNTRTGEKKAIAKAYEGLVAPSTTAKHLLGFDGEDWFTYAVPTGKRVSLTERLDFSFANEDFDSPSKPNAYGTAGWTTDGKYVLLYDRYDIWKISADGKEVINLTKFGREQGIQLRYVKEDGDDSDPDEPRGLDLTKPMLLSAKNLRTGDTGFYKLEPNKEPKLLVMGARLYGKPRKAENSEARVLTVQTFYDFPDYYLTDADFREMKRITNANSNVRQFNWGKAELVEYRSIDGTPLSGVLVKPENFDPTKKYPMVVYIYERLTSNLHTFRLPTVTRGQVINPTFYASNGYLVLMPDISYNVGYPGQSALKCVLPAIQTVVNEGYVDEKKVGINGQSWGGYQIAYMVTQTNRFAAAVSGAPVSNMTSAYGGIRWGTGLPRQFQYERTQSRIGGTLWEYPMRFIENSPVFMADRVETPLLMIHNDQDDAVPWYQGIEYFLALRRLEKEVYMFNYLGQPHNLSNKAAARDFSVRMFQFFEHHLRGESAPAWMTNGVDSSERDADRQEWKKFYSPDQP